LPTPLYEIPSAKIKPFGYLETGFAIFSNNFPFPELYSSNLLLSNLIWFVVLFNGGFKINDFSSVK